MSKLGLAALAISEREYSFQNEHPFQLLVRSEVLELGVGQTIYFEDIGSYRVSVIENDHYVSASFVFDITTKLVSDGTPDRLVINRQAEIIALKTAYCTEVDLAAEAYRANFITIGAGQSMVYAEKRREAEAFMADNNVVGPHLQGEADSEGVTILAKATEILGMAQGWSAISAQIEVVRLGTKKAIQAAESPEQILAIANGLTFE